jgi:hypothetical protein
MVYDASMRPPRRQLSDQQQQRLRALLGKAQLQPSERGELAALSRNGTQAQRQEAQAKLSRGDRPTARMVGDAILRVLDEGA